MHVNYITDETWAFECGHCGHHWSVGYEVRHTDDLDGGEVCLWSRQGLPSMAPEAGIPCPRCDEGLRVSASPARRPEGMAIRVPS